MGDHAHVAVRDVNVLQAHHGACHAQLRQGNAFGEQGMYFNRIGPGSGLGLSFLYSQLAAGSRRNGEQVACPFREEAQLLRLRNGMVSGLQY